MIGIPVTIPISKFTVDLKPQYVIRTVGVFIGDFLDMLGIDDYYLYGNGFVLGNSIVRSTKKGFTYSLDLDYLSSSFSKAKIDGIRFDDRDLDFSFKYNSFRVGIGVRYNF